MNWETVAAGASVSANITMAPMTEGHIEGFRSFVEYKATAEGPIQVIQSLFRAHVCACVCA